MSELERPDGARIHYQVHGDGYPVLLLAPGVSSQIESWEGNFYDPVEHLSRRFQVIAMDQRHAGRSLAPAVPFSYEQTTADQVALLDHLGLRAAHVVAAGDACTLAWRLAHDAPERVRSVVCQQPVGRDESNSLGTFFGEFDEAMRIPRAEGMAGVIALAERDGRFDRNPGAGPFGQRLHDDPEFRAEIAAMRREYYITLLVRYRDGYRPDGSAYFSVPEEWVAGFPVPMLVLPGDDQRHPANLAKRLGRDVRTARVLPSDFAAPAALAATVTAITDFLTANTPS